jgi:ketosteroid isomerase-like protein
VQIVRCAHDTWLAGDTAGAVALLSEDFEWVEPVEQIDSDIRRGRDGVLSSIDWWTGAWAEYRFEVLDLVEAGDRVLARCRQSGRGQQSGITVEADQYQVWTVREGMPVRMEMFLHEEPARRAAGLEPS